MDEAILKLITVLKTRQNLLYFCTKFFETILRDIHELFSWIFSFGISCNSTTFLVDQFMTRDQHSGCHNTRPVDNTFHYRQQFPFEKPLFAWQIFNIRFFWWHLIYFNLRNDMPKAIYIGDFEMHWILHLMERQCTKKVSAMQHLFASLKISLIKFWCLSSKNCQTVMKHYN